MRKKVCFTLLLSFVLYLNMGCSLKINGKEETVKAESEVYAMNTYMTFTAYGDGAGEALEDVGETIREAERLWSVTDTKSELYLANHSGGTSVEISAQMEEIDRLLRKTDYRKVQLEGSLLTVPDSMQLDLGAVGKGYASDLAVEKLKEHGVESAVISLGGNIHALGKKPDGRCPGSGGRLSGR